MLKFVLYDFFLYFHFYIKYFLSINQYLMSQTNAQHWLIRPKEKMLHDWRERERTTNQSMEEKNEKDRGGTKLKEKKSERSWTLKCVSQVLHSSKLWQVLHMLIFIA